MSEIGDEKQRIREEIWRKMEALGIARFPKPVYGRIPNFKGAEEACMLLAKQDFWKKAQVIKVNPDSPQRKARELALIQEKVLIMPTPRLKKGFLILEPSRCRGHEKEASTIRGAFRFGKLAKAKDLPEVDLFLVGSVAVDLRGNRIGKGGGYGDLECAIMVELSKLKGPVVTTVHEIQILPQVPFEPHDLVLDFVITPRRVIRTKKERKNLGILWEKLAEKKSMISALLN